MPASRRSELAGFECRGTTRRFARNGLRRDAQCSNNSVRYSVFEIDCDGLVGWIVRYEGAASSSILECAIGGGVGNDRCIHLPEQGVGVRPIFGHAIRPKELERMLPRDARQRCVEPGTVDT